MIVSADAMNERERPAMKPVISRADNSEVRLLKTDRFIGALLMDNKGYRRSFTVATFIKAGNPCYFKEDVRLKPDLFGLFNF